MKDFFEKYYLKMRNFVAQRVEDEDVVEELTNDILLSGWNSLPNFNHKSSEFSWLGGIAKHKIIDYYRKKKLKTILFSASPIFEEIADEALSPERDVLKNELKSEIKKTFKELTAGYRKILRLKYVDGRKMAEIAQILKISVKAVESKLIRAKRKFREVYSYDKKKS